jgi:hypothetical protein
MGVTPEDLRKVYDWRVTQTLMFAKGCFVLAGLILTPLLTASFSTTADVSTAATIACVLSMGLVALAGACWHLVADDLQEQFLEELESS